MPSEIFLKYLDAILSCARLRRESDFNHPFARVTLTTLERAAGLRWGHVLFLQANEGVWPAIARENPFLNDRRREELNARRGPNQGTLQRAFDLTGIERRRFVEILENCSGEALLLACAQDPAKPEHPLNPNEFLIQRMLLENPPRSLKEFWLPRQRAPEWRIPSKLEQAERDRLRSIRQGRINAQHPFDEYLLHLPPRLWGRREGSAWPASQLDDLWLRPGEFALRWVFDAKPFLSQDMRPSESLAVGVMTHRWLGKTIRLWNESGRTSCMRALLDAEAQRCSRDMNARFTEAGTKEPIWWRSTFARARAMGLRLLERLGDLSAWPIVVTEEEIDGRITTSQGALCVEGRIDLAARDRREWNGASAWIVDFKTGRQAGLSPVSMKKGKGLQFGAYLLLALEEGAASVRVDCLADKPGSLKGLTDVYREEIRASMADLARLQREGCFGMRGPLVAEYGRAEALPMATVPIPKPILERKAVRSNALGDDNLMTTNDGDERDESPIED
jgi:hypothetical protein